MRKHVNQWMLSILMITSLCFIACQEEFEEPGGTVSQDNFVVGSATSQLVQQTTNNDGSFDNIVDGASYPAI